MTQEQIQIPIDAFQQFECTYVLSDNTKSFNPVTDICRSTEFEQVFQLKTYKGLMSQGKRVVMQIPVFRCCKCGAIYDPNSK